MAKKLIVTDTALGKLKHVPLDRDLEQMLISAERYACGRMTYIVGTTVDYILSMLPHLSDWCIGVMQNDMKSEFDMYERAPNAKNLGMSCDYVKWLKFKDALDEEMERRKHDGT